jgi:hypothetical protein
VSGEVSRRLGLAGYGFEPSSSGKHLWRQPETGRLLPEDEAFRMVRQEERELLKAAGWERVEVDAQAFWRRPDTGRLYPRGPAVDVLRAHEEEEAL